MIREGKNTPVFTPPHELSGMDASSPILLGLSGGADSRLLLHLLASYCSETGAVLYAAHVDHGIRGAEAERDREFCLALAESYGIKCFVLRCDVPALAKEHRESLETEARRVRYEFFGSVMRKEGIKILATAHNADDNLETMLFNLARGSGIRGIGGIQPSRPFGGGVLIRPLLGTPKAVILDCCREQGLEFVTDSTNADVNYSRNLIRHKIIPLLGEINGGVLKNAARLSASAHAADEFITHEAEEYLKREDAYSVGSLRGLHPTLRAAVLAIMYNRASGRSAEEVHLRGLALLLERGVPNSALSLPGLVRATIKCGRLEFVPDPRKQFRHL